MYCPQCGVANASTARSCAKCGASLDAQAIAGASLTGTRPQTSTATRGGGNSKVTAGLLGILLGGLGVHKFYLGQIGWGIGYVLLCWTYVPALVGLIEGIIYLTTNDDDFAAKYG